MVKIGRGDAHENFEFSKQEFEAFYQQLTFLSEAELLTTPDIPKEKVEMLAVSFVLMDWVMKLLKANSVISSAFSMKAGILHEMSLS